jgi:hypothetical protein
MGTEETSGTFFSDTHDTDTISEEKKISWLSKHKVGIYETFILVIFFATLGIILLG